MIYDLIILFSSAFVSATILPFFSEVILTTLLNKYPVILLVITATAANTLGALLNWWLGTELLRFQNKKWFYFKPNQIEKAQQNFQRYGLWTLLFAWLPIIGDPLTLVAGIMRVHWRPFIILVAIGKGARYCILAYGASWIL